VDRRPAIGVVKRRHSGTITIVQNERRSNHTEALEHVVFHVCIERLAGHLFDNQLQQCKAAPRVPPSGARCIPDPDNTVGARHRICCMAQ
jgi:hypothetical protein